MAEIKETGNKKVLAKKTTKKKTNSFNDLYKRLSRPVPRDMIITYEEDGKEFTGYNAQYAINLLNEELGLENVLIKEDILKQEYIGKGWLVAMKVEITLKYGENEATRCGYSAAYSKRAANAYKGAKTSAFKNACRFFGIGQELYGNGFDEEILEVIHAGKEEKTEEKTTEKEEGESAGNEKARGEAQQLIDKIECSQTKEELEALRDTVNSFEGSGAAIKKLVLKKFNTKLISLDV